MSVMTDAFQIYLTGKEADEERESNHVRSTPKLDTPQYFFAVKESNSGIINVSLKFKTQQNTKAENTECYTNKNWS